MDYSWDFSALHNYWPLWIRGLVVTIAITIPIIMVGTILGAVLVVGLRSQSTPIRFLCRIYTDVFRAIPALVLLGTLYFCLPLLFDIRITPMQTALIGLTLNLSPFAAECIRSGIDSIPNIQYQSARVLGFNGWNLAYYIIGPQAVRRIVPPLVSQYISALKLSSLAATIGVMELWNVTNQVVVATALPLEARLVGAALYLVIILPLVWLQLWLEKKFQVKGLGGIAER